jgi:hypothetical protein
MTYELMFAIAAVLAAEQLAAAMTSSGGLRSIMGETPLPKYGLCGTVPGSTGPSSR